MTPFDLAAAACFWCCALGVAYAYAGYPLLIAASARLFGARAAPPPFSSGVDPRMLPRVTLLIVAHNEAEVIEERIRNALALDYPDGRLDIVVASDGSDDATVEICRRYEDRLRCWALTRRQGKAAALNAVIPHLEGELLVLSDANTLMEPAAIGHLARWFADPSIGAVCGRLVLRDAPNGANADSLYWRYETFLKLSEGRLGALLGANGAIYALRRELFQPLPQGAVLDDFLIPLLLKLRTGRRIAFDPQAVAFEETAPDLRGEFRRRARIGAGGVQALGVLWPLLHPRHGWTALALWSHKVLRWTCPVLMLGALVSSLVLALGRPGPLYVAAALAQSAFYALSAVGALLPARLRAQRILRVGTMFTTMNLALLAGVIRGLLGHQTGMWRRTARGRPPELVGSDDGGGSNIVAGRLGIRRAGTLKSASGALRRAS